MARGSVIIHNTLNDAGEDKRISLAICEALQSKHDEVTLMTIEKTELQRINEIFADVKYLKLAKERLSIYLKDRFIADFSKVCSRWED